MASTLPVDIPAPLFPVGTWVIALIDYKPRYALIQRAYLNVHFVLEADDLYYVSSPRWEYEVRVEHESEEELMVIAERTIICVIADDRSDQTSA